MPDPIKEAVNKTWEERKTWGTFFKGLPLLLKYNKPKYGGGLHGGAGAGSLFVLPTPEYELVKDTLWVPVLESYNDAFANARKKGLKTFMFNGELKNTELGNDPKALEAGAKRFQNIGLIPIERTKLVEKKQEVPKGQEGLIAKLNPLNWFKKEEPKEKYLGSWSLQPITEDNTYYNLILNSLLLLGVPLEEAKKSAAMSDRMAKETKVFSSTAESNQSLNRNGRNLGTMTNGEIMNLSTTEQGDSIWSYGSKLEYPHLNKNILISIHAGKNADSDDYHYNYEVWENGKRKTEYGDGLVPSHIRPYLDKVNAAASKGIKRGTNGL